MARWAVAGSLALWAMLGCGVVEGAVVSGGVIDTYTGWNKTDAVSPFGETNTATYGQTFTVPTTYTLLQSFTFYLNDKLNTDYVDFKAYVAAWDGYKATGAMLFTSGGLSTSNNHGIDGFEQITINTGGISLTSGAQYIAFFSASERFDGISGTSDWGRTSDIYAGGYFVHSNSGSNFSWLTAYDWDKTYSGYDSAFKMVLSDPNAPAVPEPASLAVWSVLGGMGIAVARWQKRKAKA